MGTGKEVIGLIMEQQHAPSPEYLVLAYTCRAECQAQLKNYPDALEYITHALKSVDTGHLSREYVPPLYAKSATYQEARGKWSLALGSRQRAAKGFELIKPVLPGYIKICKHDRLANAFAIVSDFALNENSADAIASFDEAIKLKGESKLALPESEYPAALAIGGSLYRQHQLAESVKWMETADQIARQNRLDSRDVRAARDLLVRVKASLSDSAKNSVKH